MEVRRTSLYEKHVALHAKMAPFAGFEMPLQYTSAKDEVMYVRKEAGIFDVSHMGEFFIEGPDAQNFVDYFICNDFVGAGDRKAVYSPICRENGTMVDDAISYKISNNLVLICVNASNMEKDWKWINEVKKKTNFNCTITNKSDDYSLLAVQGPKIESILEKMGILPKDNPPYYSVREMNYKNEKLIMARTGYTGEDGFEIFCSHKMANTLWDELVKLGVKPCGLVSRDVLRLEVCFPLYGNELSDEVTPLDSGLKWTVKMNKKDFMGKKALETYKPKFRQVKLLVDKGIPRDGYPINNEKGEVIGKVTSGTFSIVLNKGIAFAAIDVNKFPENKKFFVNIRNKMVETTYQTQSFVTGGHK